MSSQTNERAFESYVEENLHTRGGWKRGILPEPEWDPARALFSKQALAFIEETQPKLWTEMRGLHGAGLEALLMHTRQRARPQRHASRARTWVQVLRKDLSARVL
jgi:type I restriction enzyme R subunit